MTGGLRRWLRGDHATNQRIKALESQVAILRVAVADGREVYLQRVRTCAECILCNASAESLTDLPDHEPGDAS